MNCRILSLKSNYYFIYCFLYPLSFSHHKKTLIFSTLSLDPPQITTMRLVGRTSNSLALSWDVSPRPRAQLHIRYKLTYHKKVSIFCFSHQECPEIKLCLMYHFGFVSVYVCFACCLNNRSTGSILSIHNYHHEAYMFKIRHHRFGHKLKPLI